MIDRAHFSEIVIDAIDKEISDPRIKTSGGIAYVTFDALAAAGYEIVEKGQAEAFQQTMEDYAEAVDEREALAMRLAKAEGLAEAAKRIGVAAEGVCECDHEVCAWCQLEAALSAFLQGGDGWRPIPEGDEDAKARGIDFPPSDVDLLLWSQPWGHDEGTMEVGFWHNSRGGSIHSTARFWRPLPKPPTEAPS